MLKPPVCRNETCPKFRTRDEVIVLRETPTDVSFGCKACGGLHVVTLDPRRGEQERDYQTKGRPEYARNRRFFFQGRNSHVGG